MSIAPNLSKSERQPVVDLNNQLFTARVMAPLMLAALVGSLFGFTTASGPVTFVLWILLGLFGVVFGIVFTRDLVIVPKQITTQTLELKELSHQRDIDPAAYHAWINRDFDAFLDYQDSQLY